jgi:hypothetical protein
MCPDELAPCHSPPLAAGPNTPCPQPGAHRRRGNHHPQALQFADDALIPPPRVVVRQAERHFSHLPPQWRATHGTHVGPPLRDQAPMPAKQGRRCEDEGRPARAAGDDQQQHLEGRDVKHGASLYQRLDSTLQRRSSHGTLRGTIAERRNHNAPLLASQLVSESVGAHLGSHDPCTAIRSARSQCHDQQRRGVQVDRTVRSERHDINSDAWMEFLIGTRILLARKP